MFEHPFPISQVSTTDEIIFSRTLTIYYTADSTVSVIVFILNFSPLFFVSITNIPQLSELYLVYLFVTSRISMRYQSILVEDRVGILFDVVVNQILIPVVERSICYARILFLNILIVIVQLVYLQNNFF